MLPWYNYPQLNDFNTAEGDVPDNTTLPWTDTGLAESTGMLSPGQSQSRCKVKSYLPPPIHQSFCQCYTAHAPCWDSSSQEKTGALMDLSNMHWRQPTWIFQHVRGLWLGMNYQPWKMWALITVLLSWEAVKLITKHIRAE